MMKKLMTSTCFVSIAALMTLFSCKINVVDPTGEGGETDGRKEGRGGAVGFVTGEEKEGSVPVDGIFAEAPQITAVTTEMPGRGE